ncbi:MAG: hypothetical protein ACLRSD_02645 [Oscillibacter sp.]
MESRCDQLYRLKKKYGSSVEEMLAYLEKSREELDRIEYADDRAQQLEQTLKKQEKAAREAAQASPTAVTRRQRSLRSVFPGNCASSICRSSALPSTFRKRTWARTVWTPWRF